ncbi:VOC family protein [Puniceibacterium sp. IMCC21224]|jgi:catechol 2,3-dioxygenase-like lactoylglutathione lyase family enzyme|uniref:VOC family protein n=1 Tax=Puniceibacterium sp. IMCC21224 TaxID=1618204 RepID=UPI00064DAB62|nr:VOC family protein [Puniceibacterium sp. IMCC21224]KMK64498.1 putative ring-cleavage extradiol dioxygenase [Puniceibacterium sp. IMCC21224]
MTVIRSRVISQPGEGHLGVHSLNHFAMTVPSLEEAERFHTGFGLDVVNRATGYAARTEGYNHDWALFIEGAAKRFHHLSFGVFPEDLSRFQEHIEASGLPLLDAPPGFQSNGLWLHDHDGNLIELKVTAKTAPEEKYYGTHLSSLPGEAGAPKRQDARQVRPRRLAHVLIFTRDVDRAVRFYVQIFGMGLSDRSGNDIAFMHGRHGSDHHMVAFVRSEAPGIHHTSWDVPSVDQVGLGAKQMADKGFVRGWGVGRHVLGSNFFHYVRDPWGSYAEYSCDIDYIPADVEWEGRDHAAEDSFYIWGPEPPKDFTVNHEA